MGEYYNNVKLGTMDDWRYVRREECQHITPKDETVNWGLKPANNVLFRFPWPDEDGMNYTASNNRDMFRGWTLGVYPGIEPESHALIYCPVSDHGCYNVNVRIPCPASPEFAASGLQHSPLDGAPVGIVGERYDELGRPRTIFECCYCHQYFSLSPAEIEKLRAAYTVSYIRTMNGWNLKVLERLMPHL